MISFLGGFTPMYWIPFLPVSNVVAPTEMVTTFKFADFPLMQEHPTAREPQPVTPSRLEQEREELVRRAREAGVSEQDIAALLEQHGLPPMSTQ
ncbi:MAG: hypothetical protein MHM6MM_007122 [Cercozoa sp. M6MM]